jgi:ATP-binding cassette subfamily B protein
MQLIYFRRVLPYVSPYWRLAAASLCLIFVAGLTGLLTPWPLQILIDYVLPNKTLPASLVPILGSFSQGTVLLIAVAASFLVTVLVHGIAVVDRYVNTKLEQGMALDFRLALLEHSQKLSMAFHDRRRAGQLIFAINSQGESVSRLVMAIPPLGQSAISLVGMVWICWRMDPQLTVIALSIVPVLYLATNYYMKHIHARLLEVRGMEGEALAIVHEAVSMVRVIVAFGREEHETRRFRQQGEQAIDARVNLTVRQALFSLAIASTTALGTALVLGVGFRHALQGTITVGQLLVILSYISMVYQPLSTISSMVGSLQEVFVSLKIAFGVLDTVPDIEDAPGAVSLERVSGYVGFEDIHFSYEGRAETLKGISFQARPGDVVAVVGQTGAGKTTLVSLIPRFYDASRGSVTIDGHDTRTLTLKSLRRQISIVLQEPVLFSATIASNIAYSRSDATFDQIVEAAKAANAHEFISALPNGYDTVLGERGAKLSGGERQRISVARAFLKNAPILLLDEPTSSIDTKTEEVILDALDKLMIGRTTFIIAHRLSTIRRAELVVVLDHGQLVESGPLDELMARDGPYRRLHELQTRKRQAKAPTPAAV